MEAPISQDDKNISAKRKQAFESPNKEYMYSKFVYDSNGESWEMKWLGIFHPKKVIFTRR